MCLGFSGSGSIAFLGLDRLSGCGWFGGWCNTDSGCGVDCRWCELTWALCGGYVGSVAFGGGFGLGVWFLWRFCFGGCVTAFWDAFGVGGFGVGCSC